MATSNSIVVVEQISIEGVTFNRGDVIGEIRDGKPVGTVEGVTRGHLEARLRSKLVQVGPLPELEPPAGTPTKPNGKPDYKAMKQPELLAEVNSRRESGRNVTIASNKKDDLIAALEADDEQQALQQQDDQDDDK